jgi:hypothetical protein
MQQLTDASALMGRDVKYTDPQTQTELWGKVDSVRIKDGLAVLNIGGNDVPLNAVSEIGTAPVVPPAA